MQVRLGLADDRVTLSTHHVGMRTPRSWGAATLFTYFASFGADKLCHGYADMSEDLQTDAVDFAQQVPQTDVSPGKQHSSSCKGSQGCFASPLVFGLQRAAFPVVPLFGSALLKLAPLAGVRKIHSREGHGRLHQEGV